MPPEWHHTFLYDDDRELRVKLTALLKGKGPWHTAAELADYIERYDWSHQGPVYDAALEGVVRAEPDS